MQRFLDPDVLAGISSLDLLAKTVVDGFVAGLHRSPDFGFSQEFAEYRAYTPGDDLRHVDWNLFARTERCYLKRYRGETNSQLTILLDASNSMQYTSGPSDQRWTTPATSPHRSSISPFAISATRQDSSSSMTRSAITSGPPRDPDSSRGFSRAWSARSPGAHRFCKAAAALSELSPSPRHRDRDLRLLRESRDHRPHHRAVALSRPRGGICSTSSIRRRFDR